MNTYTARFWAKCPANGAPINYTITIQTGAQLMVEAIQTRLEQVTEGYHEQIADELLQAFGGEQVITAMHHGVQIETRRPMLPHWLKASETASPTAAERSPAHEQPFEEWWQREGQFCRSGGGDYEKAFAWNAWRAARAATPAPAPSAPLRDAQEQPFEEWWEREGQFCRSGGGDYEKTFAWNAWCAALAATPAPAPQWQPIETAPMDGRFALVYRPLAAQTKDQEVEVKQLIGGNWPCWNQTVPAGHEPYNPTDGACHVTHWMPLPAAPVPQWTPEAAARTLALAEELRDKIKAKPDDEAGQGKEAGK